jgi:sulfide:quinone oxidoreductase
MKSLDSELAVAPQIDPASVPVIAAAGYRSIICNRPDGEGEGQTPFREIESAANACNIATRYLPVVSGKIGDDDVRLFAEARHELPGPQLAYCRTGKRSATLWALSEATKRPMSEILLTAKAAGFELGEMSGRIANGGVIPKKRPERSCEIVIVGGGSAGIAVASSLLRRHKNLDITIVDPADTHYYQPGFTLVGAGVFRPEETARPMADQIPAGVKWIKAAVVGFEPDNNCVVLEDSRLIKYKYLIVTPGLKLNWAGVEGLTETLGKNGVTSNYRYDLAPYTWQLVQNLKSGRAVFTQPAMPIKCAGAPQKAMYLSADHWRRQKCLQSINIDFFLSTASLFGVPEYVPALMEYIKLYGINLHFGHTLKAVDGPAHKAWITKAGPDGPTTVETSFDMLHAVPPQTAPDFIRASVIADQAGWVDVDQNTLRHKKYANIYALGDAGSSPNAKTAAAARKQAPVVAQNVLADMRLISGTAHYDGYGSCPLTVERGKIVLAEFAYGGKVTPSFPSYIIDGTKPSRAAWILKETVLPYVYWKGMLKGREWLVKPKVTF